jgi:type II secretion system protein I
MHSAHAQLFCSPSLKGKGLGVRSDCCPGFTLIEVMIAVGVLGIAMLALLSLHDSNLQRVLRGQELSTASVLAQGLMTQAELERIPVVGRTSGTFDKAYPGAYRNFRWERAVELSGMFPDLRKVEVRIYYGPHFARSLSVVEFIHDPTPQNIQGVAGTAASGQATPQAQQTPPQSQFGPGMAF